MKTEKVLKIETLEDFRVFLLNPWKVSKEENIKIHSLVALWIENNSPEMNVGVGSLIQDRQSNERHVVLSEYYWRYVLSQRSNRYVSSQIRKLRPYWEKLKAIGYTEQELRYEVDYVNNEFYAVFLERAINHEQGLKKLPKRVHRLSRLKIQRAMNTIINAREYFFALDERKARQETGYNPV